MAQQEHYNLENQLANYCNRHTSVLNASYLKENSALEVQSLAMLIRIISGCYANVNIKKKKLPYAFPTPNQNLLPKRLFFPSAVVSKSFHELKRKKKKEVQYVGIKS